MVDKTSRVTSGRVSGLLIASPCGDERAAGILQARSSGKSQGWPQIEGFVDGSSSRCKVGGADGVPVRWCMETGVPETAIEDPSGLGRSRSRPRFPRTSVSVL